MENKPPEDDEFQLYHNIIHGTLQPHLTANKEEKVITNLYTDAVLSAAGYCRTEILRTLPKAIALRVCLAEKGNFIRYYEVASKAGEKTIQFRLDENYFLHPENKKEASHCDPIQLPLDVTSAYYLFILDKELDRIRSRFLELLRDKNAKLSNIHHYCNSNLQSLTTLAKDAYTYEQELKLAGHNDITNPPYYVIYVLKRHIIKVIKLLLEKFTPFIDAPPSLLQHIIAHLYKPWDALKPGVETRVKSSTSPSIGVRIKLLSDKSEDEQSSESNKQDGYSWHMLFKARKAADDILSILRDEGYITEDSYWCISPPQRTMIALYRVLLDKGYFKTAFEEAPILSAAFNHQFHTKFGNKCWQFTMRNSVGTKYMELFKGIPTYHPS